MIDPCERSVFQLLEQFVRGENTPKGYRSTDKARANVLKKFFANVFRRFAFFYYNRRLESNKNSFTYNFCTIKIKRNIYPHESNIKEKKKK